MSPPAKKRAKTAETAASDLADQVWAHYRNFLDSCQQEENEEGDMDELQEIVTLLKDVPATSIVGMTREALLPVVASLAHLQLANVAILQTVDDDSGGEAEQSATMIRHHLQESLRYFPHNCAAWSVGANYARMGQLVSPSLIARWYSKAAQYALTLRAQALELLEGDDTAVEDGAVKEWLELLILVGMVDTEYVDKDDDEAEEEVDISEEKEDEEEEEEEGYYSTSAVEATSRFMSAMLLSTLGKHDESLKELQYFDLTHRLHPNVWHPKKGASKGKKNDGPTEFNGAVLPKELYEKMCDTFAPDAVYWKESDYAHRGYYSYFFDIQEPSNLIEEVIVKHLLPLAKKCQKEGDDEIVGAEWWVHHRPIQANLGHNLHFDTDEALLSQEGVISHPILSSVLYLTAGEEETSGPTIVLDQTPDATNAATKCWKCVPKNNAFMVFNGSLLHGVLPCPGKQDAAGDSAVIDGQDTMTWNVKQQEENFPHRLTFMVGFWTRRVPDKMKNRTLYGPCGPLPPSDSTEWVQQISTDYPKKTEPSKDIQESVLPTISPAWEVMQANEGDSLDIPHALDHRFFVNGAPKCFRDSLFEEGDCDEEC